MLTEEERENIYREEKFIYQDMIQWVFKNGAWKLEVPVFRANGEELTLLGVRRKYFSFSLTYRKTELIRRFDFKYHRKPGTNSTNEPHKHRWRENSAVYEVYAVQDIPLDNLNEALLAFLKECNIKLEGSYQALLF